MFVCMCEKERVRERVCEIVCVTESVCVNERESEYERGRKG